MTNMLPIILSSVPSAGPNEIAITLIPLGKLAYKVFIGIAMLRCLEYGLEWITKGHPEYLKKLITTAASVVVIQHCIPIFSYFTKVAIPSLWTP